MMDAGTIKKGKTTTTMMTWNNVSRQFPLREMDERTEDIKLASEELTACKELAKDESTVSIS